MKLSPYSWILLAIKDAFTADTRTQTNQIEYFRYHQHVNTKELSQLLDLPLCGNVLEIKNLLQKFRNVFKSFAERHKEDFLKNIDYRTLTIPNKKQIKKILSTSNDNMAIYFNLIGFYHKLRYALNIYDSFLSLFFDLNLIKKYHEIKLHLDQLKRLGSGRNIRATNLCFLETAHEIKIIYLSYIKSYNALSNCIVDYKEENVIRLPQLQKYLHEDDFKDVLELFDAIRLIYDPILKLFGTSSKIIEICHEMSCAKGNNFDTNILSESEIKEFTTELEYISEFFLKKLLNKQVYIDRFIRLLVDIRDIIKFNKFYFISMEVFSINEVDFNFLNTNLMYYFKLLYTLKWNYKMMQMKFNSNHRNVNDSKQTNERWLVYADSILKTKNFYRKKLDQIRNIKYRNRYFKHLARKIELKITKLLVDFCGLLC